METQPLELLFPPRTLRDLIESLALRQAEDYNRRLTAVPEPPTADALAEGALLGKIGFGIPQGARRTDPKKGTPCRHPGL